MLAKARADELAAKGYVLTTSSQVTAALSVVNPDPTQLRMLLRSGDIISPDRIITTGAHIDAS